MSAPLAVRNNTLDRPVTSFPWSCSHQQPTQFMSRYMFTNIRIRHGTKRVFTC